MRNKTLADILLMKTEDDRTYCRNISGIRSVSCPACGGLATALYYDREVLSGFLEEPLCECGWMDKRDVPYPRDGD